MSHVDNVILSISILEESKGSSDGPDQWPIMDALNAWLHENASGQRFGSELSYFHEAYGGSKFLEATIFVAAFNYLPEAEFLAFLPTLPWRHPDEVQVMIRRQHEDLFELVRIVSAEPDRRT